MAGVYRGNDDGFRYSKSMITMRELEDLQEQQLQTMNLITHRQDKKQLEQIVLMTVLHPRHITTS